MTSWDKDKYASDVVYRNNVRQSMLGGIMATLGPVSSVRRKIGLGLTGTGVAYALALASTTGVTIH